MPDKRRTIMLNTLFQTLKTKWDGGSTSLRKVFNQNYFVKNKSDTSTNDHNP